MKPAFSILRHGKINNKNIRIASRHQSRTLIDSRLGETIHADKTPMNRVLVGSNDMEHDVMAYLSENRIVAKDNSVLAVEMVVTASPEYFRPHDPDQAGEWDEERLTSWIQATKKELDKQFGKKLVHLDLHLDETTPHLHAFVIPAEEKEVKPRGRGSKGKPARIEVVLNAKAFMAKKNMIQRHTDMAAAVAHLGLVRGSTEEERGDKDRPIHTPLKDLAKITKEAERRLQEAEKTLLGAKQLESRNRQQEVLFGLQREAIDRVVRGEIIGVIPPSQSRKQAAVLVWNQQVPEVTKDDFERRARPVWGQVCKVAHYVCNKVKEAIKSRFETAKDKVAEAAMVEQAKVNLHVIKSSSKKAEER